MGCVRGVRGGVWVSSKGRVGYLRQHVDGVIVDKVVAAIVISEGHRQ